MKNRYIKFLSFIYALTIIIFSVAPWSTSKKINVWDFNFRLDYWLHFFAYAGMTFLIIVSEFNESLTDNKIRLFKISFWVLFFSCSMEIVQIPLPMRNFNVKDIIANASGILISALFCYLFRKSLIKLLLLINKKEAIN